MRLFLVLIVMGWGSPAFSRSCPEIVRQVVDTSAFLEKSLITVFEPQIFHKKDGTPAVAVVIHEHGMHRLAVFEMVDGGMVRTDTHIAQLKMDRQPLLYKTRYGGTRAVLFASGRVSLYDFEMKDLFATPPDWMPRGFDKAGIEIVDEFTVAVVRRFEDGREIWWYPETGDGKFWNEKGEMMPPPIGPLRMKPPTMDSGMPNQQPPKSQQKKPRKKKRRKKPSKMHIVN
jgi:hypothetical protein